MPPINPTKLVEKAQRFARLAFDDYHKGSDDAFALHAGTALEALGKAILAQKSPVLLVELNKNDRDSLLHLTGIAEAQRLRTITAGEVFTRVRRVYPDIGLRTTDVDQIIEDRNAAAHLHVLPAGLHTSLVRWVRATDAILAKLNESTSPYLFSWPETFWPDRSTVEAALRDFKSEMQGLVETKKAAAHAYFGRWCADVDGDLVDELRRRSLHEDAVSEVDEVVTPCPVCQFGARVSGTVDWESQDTEYGPAPCWCLDADDFRCGRCGLRLHSADEIEAAGLDLQYEVEPPEYEPDPDELDDLRQSWEEDDSGGLSSP